MGLSPCHHLSLACKKLSLQIGEQIGTVGRQAAEANIAIGTYKIQTRRVGPVTLMHDALVVVQHGAIPSQLWRRLLACYDHVDSDELSIVFLHLFGDVFYMVIVLSGGVRAAEQQQGMARTTHDLK